MKLFLTFMLVVSPTIKKIPIGTVKIKDYYVDKTEILNIHWLEFMYHRGMELDSTAKKRLLPDIKNQWYLNPDKRYEPVVFISYEQAIEYCQWRSATVSKKINKRVVYRLPTPGEWREISKELLKNDFKRVEKELSKTKIEIAKDSGQYSMIASKAIKNKVYHLFDNVSEMTTEKGIAMGANNFQLMSLEKNAAGVIKFTTPNAYLGFRCIAEIKE